MTHITTPYYLIDEKKLLRNLKIIRHVRQVSGAKSVLALKCFSTWCVSTDFAPETSRTCRMIFRFCSSLFS